MPLVIHLGVVVLLLAFLAVTIVTTPPEDGANFGGGFALLTLWLLGLPWSVLAFRSDAFEGFALWVIPPIVNVLLHATGRWLVGRRAAGQRFSR